MNPTETPPTTAGHVLFGPDGSRAASDQLQRQVLADTTTTGRVLSKVGLRLAITELCEALDGLLSIDLGGVLAAGWKTNRALVDAGARTAASPESSEVVDIGRHKVTSTHHPTIDVWVDDIRVSTLVFDLVLTFEVLALVAVVHQGYLTAARPSRCEVTAALTLMSVDLAKTKTVLQLPGEISFGSGYPLVKAPPAAIDLTPPSVLQPPR